MAARMAGAGAGAGGSSWCARAASMATLARSPPGDDLVLALLVLALLEQAPRLQLAPTPARPRAATGLGCLAGCAKPPSA